MGEEKEELLEDNTEEKEGLLEDNISEEKIENTLKPQFKPNPIPRKKLLPILVILFCEAFNSNTIFAYVGYMVYDFKVSDNKENLGYYAGMIASSFFVAQLCSSFFWGRLSDRIGRRPVLLLGSGGTFLSCIGLGFASNLWMAVAARCLSGFLNGNIGVVKTYLGEITDHTNQTKAFGYLGFMWGLGGIAGSMLGGLLARPAVKYPMMFSEDGIFGTYPYLLVNLLSAFFILVGLISSFLFLTENPRKSKQVKLFELELHAIPEFRTNRSSLSLADRIPSMEEESNNSLLETGEETLQKQEIVFKLFRRNLSVPLLNIDSTEPMDVEGSSTTPNLLLDQEKSIFRDRSVITTCTLYAFVGFTYTVLDDVFPLWAMQDVDKGGLGFSTNSIGIANSIAGALTVIIQLFIYHRLANWLGLIRIGSLLSGPAFLAFPLANLLFVHVFNQSETLLWIYFVCLYVLRQVASQMTFSSIMNLISNSVDSLHMGAVNGLGQSLVAGTRAIGPVAGATLLSWSLTNNLAFPFNFFFVFICCACTLSLCTLFTIKMDPSLNKPKASNDESEEPKELS